MCISIVIPTYQRADLLNRLLRSISAQTFKKVQVIVIDDNSSNQAEYEEVITEYEKVFAELLFLKNKTNLGAPYSRNRGILAAKYDLIAFVDDDDEWLPQKLQKQFQIISDSGKNVGLVYTWADTVCEDGTIKPTYRSEIESEAIKKIFTSCFIPSPSVLVTKEAVMRAGMFDETLLSCQDWDMWIRVILQGYKCKVAREVLAYHHKHGRDSIGLSPSAKVGYLQFYRKHLLNSRKSGVFVSLKYFVKALGFI